MDYLPPENLQWVRDALIDFPRPDLLARAVLEQWLRSQGVSLSPDQIDVVTLHYQFEPLGEGRAHFREQAVVTQRLSLVEALLANWQGEPAAGYAGFHYGDWAGSPPQGAVRLVERLEAPGLLENGPNYLVFNGLYRRTSPARYAPDTRIDVRAEAFQSHIWSLHFHHQYKSQLDRYWSQQFAAYQRASKISFIAACNKQLLAGTLSEPAKQLAWQLAGLMPRPTWQQRGISGREGPVVQASMLNVFGYAATSVLCMQDHHSGLTLLYLPGNSSPLHEFASESAMKQWFARQCQAPATRKALQDCFSPQDWPDGLDFSGVQTTLQGLGLYPQAHHFPPSHAGFATSGVWDPEEIINYRALRYSPPIEGDLFLTLAQRQRERSYADADNQITSNQEIDKSRWRNYLTIALNILMPIALVLPEVAPVLAVGGLAQFSLGLDQTINGKSLQSKDQGVADQVYGLLSVVPLIPLAVTAKPALFIFRRPGFLPVARMLGWGTAEEAPIALDPISSALRPDTIIARFPSTSPSYLVTRIDAGLFPRFEARIVEDEHGPKVSVRYEIRSDAFIRDADRNLEVPPRFIIPQAGGNALVRLTDAQRQVSDAQRMATLKGLGLEVELPIDFSIYPALRRTPIPRQIFSIWLGDREIAPPFLQALEHNGRALRGSDFPYQLFLSCSHRAVYQRNLALLVERVPGLTVLPLEEQPAFIEFTRSPYFGQYQAALDGNGGTATNFSSACDILRYRLLKYQGGLYLDADDKLRLPTSPDTWYPPVVRYPLSTTADGLILAPPVSNDRLGMYIKYNSSMIGSHPGNPTLDAISDEMLQRYTRDPAFYANRPDHLSDPAGFDDYARRLNHLTGPGVMNDVIDRHLPWLKQLREICSLFASPVVDAHQVVRLSELLETVRQQLPLDQLADMGNANSWTGQ